MRKRGLLTVAFLVGAAGCATKAETRVEVAAAPEVTNNINGMKAQPVTPEKLEEIDMFFRRTAGHLQFECYNTAVDKTHKKYEGSVTVGLVVMPGGKASEVKLINSTLVSTDAEKVKAPEIEQCVLDNVKAWEWPEVNGPAPYTGSINFKPAW